MNTMLNKNKLINKKSYKKHIQLFFVFALFSLLSQITYAQQNTNSYVQIGTGTNSALSLYGPVLYASGTIRAGSVSDMLFSESELSAAGLPSNAEITGIAFYKTSSAESNVNSNLAVSMQIMAANSNLTAPLATTTTLGDIIETHTVVYDEPNYKLASPTGWVHYDFDTSFTYTGEGLEFATVLSHEPPRAGTGNGVHFTAPVSWQYTSGYDDYIIGDWPIYGIDNEVVLDHNMSDFKNRPNIRIYYTTSTSNCTPVVTLSEDFQSFTDFPENCWTWKTDPDLSSSNIPLVYLNEDTSITPPEKSIAMYAFTYTAHDFYLISPAVNTINGNYVLKFDARLFSNLAIGSTLQIGTLDSNRDIASFIPVGKVISPTTTNQTFTSIAIPATAGHEYLAIKFMPAGNHSTVLIDNVVWEASASCSGDLPGVSSGDIGCVSFDYKGNTVEYTTVRGADGKIWLQQNLGSDRIANSATDEDAYGDLFQWGRWDDGHQNRDSENSNILPNPNNPAGLNGGSPYFYVTSPEWWKNGASSDTWEAETPDNVISTNGCDPCKALGENWRLPTSDEWSEVIDAENISDIASAFDSNLKLTIAGARGDNGIYNDGQKGYYWSKTTSDNPNFAKYLYYSDYIVNPTAGGFREQGSSIRCIYAIADEIVCEQPTNISEDQITDSTIEISWDASPNETSGYNWLLVDRGDSPSTANAIQQGSVPTGITNLIIQDLTPETSYDLYIQTNCDINESDWKGPIKFTTESAICDSPTDLMVDTIIDNSVVFSWVLGSNETQWEFIYGESGFDVNSEGVSQIVNEPYATIQNIPEEIEYDAYVRSICNDNQMSDWTGPISFSIENLAVADHEFNDFIFFPNPMDDELYLKANKPMEQIQIFNLLGQEVIILKTNATENILDVRSIQSGSYLMKVTMNGISKTYRIIKK